MVRDKRQKTKDSIYKRENKTDKDIRQKTRDEGHESWEEAS